jgi:hypothetical protein
MTKPLLTALVAALVLAPGAAAAKRKPKLLWATVNICDTQRHPDALGVRARMPGNGTHQRMYTRFTEQYRGADGHWRRLLRSKWDYVGTARFRWKESGNTFPPLDRKKTAATYLLRGYVEFQWRRKRRHRRGWKVVRRTQRLTTAGHPRAHGSDPKGYSAATCRISTAPAL